MLDKKDKQILLELDLNARIPLTQLAKKVNLSPQTTKYRMEQLEKKGIIKRYVTFFDVSKFGYLYYRLYIRLENTTTEEEKEIGVIELGERNGIDFIHGRLKVGEPMATPIIKMEKSFVNKDVTVIMDAPPGTSCPVIETVKGSDFCLLVTEPTPFGLHDLRLAAQVAQELGIRAGVVINRAGVGDSGVDDYCQEAELPVLMRIPLDQRIAEGIARGKALIHIQPEYIEQFRDLYARIVEIVEEKR